MEFAPLGSMQPSYSSQTFRHSASMVASMIVLFSLSACSMPASSEETEDDLRGGSIPVRLPPGVVALHTECTAVKVGTRSFLTAGHCVVLNIGGVDQKTLESKGTFERGQPMCISSQITVAPGGCENVEIVSTKVHPTYAAHVAKGFPRFVSEKLSDLALITVNRDTPKIPIAELDNAPITIGMPILMTGYGCTALGAPMMGSRTLRVGYTNLAGFSRWMANVSNFSPVGGCPGDSGGPVYRETGGTLRLVAINSFVTQQGATYFSRVDSGSEARAWVASQLVIAPTPGTKNCPQVVAGKCV